MSANPSLSSIDASASEITTSEYPVYDLIVRRATLVDGTRAPARVADVGIHDGRIVAIASGDGVLNARADQEVDAQGLLMTPGWVDIHTHYDGQVTWDPDVTPSSWHGVTTLVMGNCGVGFAPVRPGSEQFLIELMEGVEDIPGTALSEGIAWTWESFPEYLDAVDSMPRVLDVAAQVPHAALRAYVMGERAHEDPTVEEIAAMARLAEEGLRAGAVGFSTSRTILHRSKHGLVPGTNAVPDELLAICEAIARVGHRVVEMVGDDGPNEAADGWLGEVARRTGATVTYALAQNPGQPQGYRGALEQASQLQMEGLRVVPQVSNRPTGMLFGFRSSLHPFVTHPTYRSLLNRPFAERIAALRDPAIRRQLVEEGPSTDKRIALSLMTRWEQMFPLGDPPDYEPPYESSAKAEAARRGCRPEEVMLDWMLERDGEALIFVPLASYAEHNHDAIRELMTHPSTVLGLSDGGAHCGLICDASMPSYLLTHWVRDRRRGERISLEDAVHLQTQRTASVYGLNDRGSIELGKRADFNLIDLAALRLHEPEMVYDLPANGRRLVQRVDGYRATFVRGVQTFADGSPTGARPGRLVRAS
ncbi:MAG: N-acyl-D-amino-acid deacylase family protein [Ilumatobacteraceae bacterium]